MQAAILDTFSANYLKVSWAEADARTEKREERGVDTAVHARIPQPEEVEAAFAAYSVKDPQPTPSQAIIYESYEACRTKTATAEQRRLVNGVEERAVFEDYDRQHQSSRDRIIGRGLMWEGFRLAPDIIGEHGISLKFDVGGHLHLPFDSPGLISRESGSPLMLRCLTMTAKAKRSIKANPDKGIEARDAAGPRTGMAKDACRLHHRKLVAMDDLYWFFNDNCVDAFRLDHDRSWDSEAHLYAWLLNEVEEGRLAFMPNKSVCSYDDRFPGRVYNPHHYWFFPDDGGKKDGGKDGTKPHGAGSSAIWKGDRYKNQHHMLSQIAAKLNEQLGCDPGGLANISHGKNPLSPHHKTSIWHENCLTLTEMAEGLDLDLDRQEMARKHMVDALKDIGFDDKSSNNSHTVISKLSRSCTRKVAKAGIDTDDYSEFLGAAIEATTDLTKQKLAEVGIAIPPGGWKAVEKLIDGCCKWAVADFDPKKLTKSTGNTGCAKHLMLPTDDKRTRQIKGQAAGAANRADHSADLIAEAVGSIRADGAGESISEIARRSGRARHTVRRHVFSAHVARIAEQMLAAALKEPDFPKMEAGAPALANKYHVWGANAYSAEYQPSKFVIRYGHRQSDLPDSWQEFGIGVDWHGKKLLQAQSERQIVDRHPEAGPPAGRNVIDFMGSGQIKVFRSTSRRQRAA
jgi:hypothetical protein